MEQFDNKQPSEEYYLAFDFSRDLNGEGIAAAEFTIVDVDTGEDVTDAMMTPEYQVNDGDIAYLWIVGGEDGHKYKITCRVTGAGAPQSRYELEATLKVKEL